MATKQPANKSHFILPDLGEGVHEAELIRWRVKPGEKVDEHQTLAEMETDKALVEVPSPWAGTVKDLNGSEGDIINVGAILVTYDIGTAGGSNDAPKTSSQSASRPASKKATTAATGAEAIVDDAEVEREDAGTVVGNVAGELSIPSSFARSAGESNGTGTKHKALATPAVRRIARERGIDINRIPGTGRGGRVTASDVHAFTGGSGATGTRASAPSLAGVTSAPSYAAMDIPADGIAERIPFRGVRRKIAEALDRSVKTAVHFTVCDEADVTALDRKRKEYAHITGRKVSFLPFVMAAVCKALRAHPELNANVDDANAEILRKAVINLGCAVDTEHGLMVPVIPNADQLGLIQLGDEVTTLANACRNRTIERERLTGGTFTISNVGSYGGLFATPIINYPEVGILAAGRVREQVMTRDGAFYAGKSMPLSLSCDHRVVDGAEGARFLNTVVRLLEKPESIVG
ncbi:MAG: 2-oxo acid dehydrogenase subunit E2 [Phycisphaerales bacterium]|nr:2-oxo acid dehydrogenase subunit E2 [Phycisphaerales bacterium]